MVWQGCPGGYAKFCQGVSMQSRTALLWIYILGQFFYQRIFLDQDQLVFVSAELQPLRAHLKTLQQDLYILKRMFFSLVHDKTFISMIIKDKC